MYADLAYYTDEYKGLNGETIEPFLVSASFDIDILTYNRAYDGLTPFQEKIVKRVCCELADFKFENADVLETVIKNYSINGVSLVINDRSYTQINGINIKPSTYALLQQSGLCSRMLP